jgi:hypothetical protein
MNFHKTSVKVFYIQSASVINTTLGDKKSVFITGRCLYWDVIKIFDFHLIITPVMLMFAQGK